MLRDTGTDSRHRCSQDMRVRAGSTQAAKGCHMKVVYCRMQLAAQMAREPKVPNMGCTRLEAPCPPSAEDSPADALLLVHIDALEWWRAQTRSSQMRRASLSISMGLTLATGPC